MLTMLDAGDQRFWCRLQFLVVLQCIVLAFWCESLGRIGERFKAIQALSKHEGAAPLICL